MIAHRIKPNVAIVTDVTHDTNTPMINKITQGDLSAGKGPVISYAPAVQNNLNKLLIESAQKRGSRSSVRLLQKSQVQIQMLLLILTMVCHRH
jgi:putative aminopeptidase FrvX